MKKSGILGAIFISVAVLTTGCSLDPMPELTQEQSSLIAEYAAGMLLMYDKNLSWLASDEEIAEADAKEAERLANLEELLRVKEAAAKETKEGNGSTGSEKKEPQAPFNGIAPFYGIEGFSITYTGYTICDSYPEGDSADMYFAMDATEGNKLLVLQFTAQNDTGEDRELDMFAKSPSFRISINEGEAKSALTTMLLDDMAMYKETIAAGNKANLVLIREVSAEESALIQTISLTLRSGSDTATVVLE